MFRNFIKITYRNLVNNKVFSLINILGLSIGLLVCFFIFLYVYDEITYDHHNDNLDRMYRVCLNRVYPEEEIRWASIAPGPGPAYMEGIPEIESMARFIKGELTITYGDQQYMEKDIILVDTSFFSIFTVDFIKGNAGEAFSDPYSTVITQATAERYFGDNDPIGQTLYTSDTTAVTVSGVVKAWPDNSHFNFDFLMPMEVSGINNPELFEVWGNAFFFFTYILLDEDADPGEVEEKMRPITRTHMMAGQGEEEYEKWISSGNAYEFFLQPVEDIHLYSDFKWEFQPNGDVRYVYIFSAIAVFILVIACINFINLSTARSAKRAHEVGIRKILGSRRRDLILQFISESVMVALISMTIALVFAQLLLPYFNVLVNKNILFSDILNYRMISTLVLFSVVIGVLAGVYPSLVLSNFRPVSMLSSSVMSRSSKSGFRSILVIFQFTTAIVLIVGTLVVFLQLKYIQNKKLGFNKEQILVVENARELNNERDNFKTELLRRSDISSVAYSISPLWSIRGASSYHSEQQTTDEVINMVVLRADHSLLETLNVDLLAGRYFNESDGQQGARNCIINETAMKLLGYTPQDIGKKVYSHDHDNPPFTLAGVMEDFNYESLHHKVRPMIHFVVSNWAGVANIRINNSTNMPETIGYIKSEWNKRVPHQPFEYTFMDDGYDSLYKSEQSTALLFIIFSVLAIFIASLGLLGMIIFITEQRTREVGIRKALGATVTHIFMLLSRDFLWLLLIALIIGTPLAWWGMNQWLMNFEYKTDIPFWVFITGGVISLLIAMITISTHAIKSATANPVDSLRTE